MPKQLVLSEASLWMVLVVVAALAASLAVGKRWGLGTWLGSVVLIGAVAVGTGTTHLAVNEIRALHPLTRNIGLALIWVLVILLMAWAGIAKQHYRYFVGAGLF